MSAWDGKTRGGAIGYRIFIFFLKNVNIRFSYTLLRVVAGYFWLFSDKKPLLYFYQDRLHFTKWKTYKLIYRNYVMLGECLLDKIVVMAGIKNKFTFQYIGEEYLHQLSEEKRGGILIGAHMGNWEIAGHLLKRIGTKVHIVMLDAEHQKIKELLEHVLKEKNLSVIPITNSYDHLYTIERALKNGEFVAIHGDRFLPGAKTVTCNFLGQEAQFPTGPFYMAMKFQAPVCYVSAVKKGRCHYKFNATKPEIPHSANRVKTRDQELERVVASYVENLEHMVIENPTQWFNFYPFWNRNKPNLFGQLKVNKMNFGKDTKTALQAKFDAQKIAFGPIMFQAARALQRLGILETIKAQKNKGILLTEIAEMVKLPVYGVKVLLEAGLSMELVRVEENLFFLTKTGFFVLSDPLTRVNMNFVHDVNYEGFFSLEESVTNGKPEGLKVFGKWDTVYEALSQLPGQVQKSWFEFDHFYSDNAFPEILPVIFKSGPKKLLDVGGNTGKWAIQCGIFNPEVEITILDLPGQLVKAQVNIDANSLSDRVKGIPLNLLDHSIPFPEGFDIVWMSQFLDCFSQKDILELLKRAKAAIHANGSVCILETYWDKQKYEASTYSLHATSLYFTCLANGCSQMYHSEDMLGILEQAGLYVDQEIHDIGVSHTLYICKIKN